MSAFTAPTTELEAVNIMLQSIRELPVANLETEDVVAAGMARQTLRGVSRRVQSEGFSWNTDKNRKLLRTSTGKIRLPINTLSVDTVGVSKYVDAVQRGEYLYDRQNHTDRFDDDLYVDLIVALEFDQLVESARQYITLYATQVFQRDTLGSVESDRMQDDDIRMARAQLLRDDAKNADHNIFTTVKMAAPLYRLGVLRRR